ncbi:uncharacterized protein [Elaeis guineensis]|uniref:uncharacterized protein n=1 Tax=Elaeis guineensis var. tenera TaxID=51953 RepID=UPI003C6CF9C6
MTAGDDRRTHSGFGSRGRLIFGGLLCVFFGFCPGGEAFRCWVDRLLRSWGLRLRQNNAAEIKLQVQVSNRTKTLRPFRFENLWYSHSGFDQLIQTWWEGEPQKNEPAHNMVAKLRHLRQKLKSWSKEFNQRRLERKKFIDSRIDQLDLREEDLGLSSSERDERCSLKAELESFLLQDETYWKQRSRNAWLKEGDRNIKFFHISASNRRKNQIIELTSEGHTIKGQRRLHCAFHSYFTSMLGSEVQQAHGFPHFKFTVSFHRGRLIFESYVVASEVISFAKRTKASGILCKLDFEKAFDNVSWHFLLKLLKERDFGEKWISWVQMLLIFSTSGVMVNGELGSWFKNQRGLKQGNPLSPLLFVLVTDTLKRILNSAVEENLIQGIGLGDITGKINCIQFADDTLILCAASKNCIKMLKLILYLFVFLTGLKINFNKSNLIGLNLPYDPDSKLAQILGCQRSFLPFKYLGIPLSFYGTKPGGWNLLVQKIERKLAGWKQQTLSRAGRLTLINTVLRTIPIYWMAVHLIPSSVITRIDKVCRSFL